MNHFISFRTKTMDEILNKVTKLLDLYKKIKNKIESTKTIYQKTLNLSQV